MSNDRLKLEFTISILKSTPKIFKYIMQWYLLHQSGNSARAVCAGLSLEEASLLCTISSKGNSSHGQTYWFSKFTLTSGSLVLVTFSRFALIQVIRLPIPIAVTKCIVRLNTLFCLVSKVLSSLSLGPSSRGKILWELAMIEQSFSLDEVKEKPGSS